MPYPFVFNGLGVVLATVAALAYSSRVQRHPTAHGSPGGSSIAPVQDAHREPAERDRAARRHRCRTGWQPPPASRHLRPRHRAGAGKAWPDADRSRSDGPAPGARRQEGKGAFGHRDPAQRGQLLLLFALGLGEVRAATVFSDLLDELLFSSLDAAEAGFLPVVIIDPFRRTKQKREGPPVVPQAEGMLPTCSSLCMPT